MFDRQAACDLVKEEYGRLLSDEEFVEEVRKTIPKFNHEDVVESTTKPTITEPITGSTNPKKRRPLIRQKLWKSRKSKKQTKKIQKMLSI